MWNKSPQVLKNALHNNVAKRVAVQSKHVGDTNKLNLEWQLACSVFAVRAVKNARHSADVVQSDETEQNNAPIRV